MNVRPKVLLVNYEFPPIGGGAGTATAGMAAALAALGCDVVVLTSRFRDQPRVVQADGYTIRRVPVVRRHADRCTPPEMLTFMASGALAALRLTRTWKPALTIAFFGIPGGPVGWLLRAMRGTPYIVSLRGGDVPGFVVGPVVPLSQRLAAPVLRFIWKRATAVVANGAGLRDLAREALPGLDVHVIPNGVDTVRHAPARRLAVGPPRILLVGRLAYQKAVDVLLRSLARLHHVDFRCDIVGDGPDRAALEQLAAELGLAAHVHFHGWVQREQLPALYGAADIVALASRMEGMPNVVLEAMAHGLPVVATDVPGTRDLVRQGETGLLVRPGDDEDLATALGRLLRDTPLRRRMGDAARAHVLANHTWERAAAAYLRLAGLEIPRADGQAAVHAATRAGAAG